MCLFAVPIIHGCRCLELNLRGKVQVDESNIKIQFKRLKSRGFLTKNRKERLRHENLTFTCIVFGFWQPRVENSLDTHGHLFLYSTPMYLLSALNDGAETLEFNSIVRLTLSPRESVNVEFYFSAVKPPRSEFLQSTFPLCRALGFEIFSSEWKKIKTLTFSILFRPKRNKHECLSSL